MVWNWDLGGHILLPQTALSFLAIKGEKNDHCQVAAGDELSSLDPVETAVSKRGWMLGPWKLELISTVEGSQLKVLFLAC